MNKASELARGITFKILIALGIMRASDQAISQQVNTTSKGKEIKMLLEQDAAQLNFLKKNVEHIPKGDILDETDIGITLQQFEKRLKEMDAIGDSLPPESIANHTPLVQKDLQLKFKIQKNLTRSLYTLLYYLHEYDMNELAIQDNIKKEHLDKIFSYWQALACLWV